MYTRPILKRQNLSRTITLLCVLLIASLAAARPLTFDTANALHSLQDGATNLLNLRLGAGELTASASEIPKAVAAFNALQTHATGTLSAHWNAHSHIPEFVTSWDPTVRLPYTPKAAEIGNPAAVARGFLSENRDLFSLSSVEAELQPARSEPDAMLNYAHLRMDQVYKGIPVFGKQLVVHLDPQERIVAVTGQFRPNLNIATEPSLSKTEAEDLAVQDLLETQLDPDESARAKPEVKKDRTQLMVYVDDKGHPTLTWRVTILNSSPLSQWTFFVNARRPLIVHSFDSAEQIKERATYTARNGTDIPGRRIINEGERSSDPIAQAAHDAAGKVYDYYFNTHKRDSVDGQGLPLVSTVHYGSDPEDAENAAWIGEAQQMIYGDGGSTFKPLAYGLDVVGHEFTHGVVDSTSQLIYEGQSGALNESYADVFGVLIDGATQWTVGRQVIKSPPYPVPFLRSLEDPNARRNYNPRDPLGSVGQPAHMREYARLPLSRRADNGGVHVNSGVPNRAAYLVAKAVGKQKMERIYYRTLTQYLSPDSDFQSAGLATVRAATDLYGAQEAAAVRKAFADVGIDVGSTAPEPAPPSGQPTPPRRATPVPDQPLPAGCADIIKNGALESDSEWTQVPAKRTKIIDSELPHTEAKSAWLGGTDKEPVQYIYQDVAVPANAASVELSYFRLVHYETKGVSGLFAAEATFSIVIADADGNVLSTIEELESSKGDDQWRQVQADLSRYAGKTIRLAFTAENPRGNISSMFVDDVAIAACTTGASPNAPPTSSQDLVYVEGEINNADTGRGVEGAQVYILKPGISATQAAADEALSESEVLTAGVSDANGLYQTELAIPRGKSYSVIIVASRYRPIIADNGISIPANADNPYTVDATLRRSR